MDDRTKGSLGPCVSRESWRFCRTPAPALSLVHDCYVRWLPVENLGSEFPTVDGSKSQKHREQRQCPTTQYHASQWAQLSTQLTSQCVAEVSQRIGRRRWRRPVVYRSLFHRHQLMPFSFAANSKNDGESKRSLSAFHLESHLLFILFKASHFSISCCLVARLSHPPPSSTGH